MDPLPEPELGFGILPEVVRREILKKSIFTMKTILNSRLVCVEWNGIIEDTSELMKNLKFPIWDAIPFLDLQIVKNGKVRSIIFKDSTALESFDCKELFMHLISNTIENVEFAFEDSNAQQQSELFKLILENCYNLKEITVKSKCMLQMENGQFDYTKGVLKFITAETVIVSVNKIKLLSISMDGIGEQDFRSLMILILRLPKLKEIQLTTERVGLVVSTGSTMIILGLMAYLRKFSEALHLKKLTLSRGFTPYSLEDTKTCTLLYMQCARFGVVINGPLTFNFNRLLDLWKAHTLELRHLPLFPTQVDGDIAIEGGSLLTNLSQVVGELSVGHLRIMFKRYAWPGEVNWVRDLRSLEGVVFVIGDDVKLGPPTAQELNRALSVGIHTLKSLDFRDNLGGVIPLLNWNQCFPNLKELQIFRCGSTPNNLITKLVELESLSMLSLRTLLNLNDIAFTMECENRFETDNGSSSMAPAIACFKSLKYLDVKWCPLLTDECVINGISKCETLDELVICSCRNITNICENLVQGCEVKYTAFENNL